MLGDSSCVANPYEDAQTHRGWEEKVLRLPAHESGLSGWTAHRRLRWSGALGVNKPYVRKLTGFTYVEKVACQGTPCCHDARRRHNCLACSGSPLSENQFMISSGCLNVYPLKSSAAAVFPASGDFAFIGTASHREISLAGHVFLQLQRSRLQVQCADESAKRRR